MSARDAVTRHCGYNSCAGDVTCECVCVGCIVACRRFADAVMRKATAPEAPNPADVNQWTAKEVMELGRRVARDEMGAELAAARREGRDAGLREARGALLEAARDAHGRGHGDYDGLVAGERIIEQLIGRAPSPAPDIASLQAENAKLRAVAEAAARLQRWRRGDQGSYADGSTADATLTEALDRALPGWHSAP